MPSQIFGALSVKNSHVAVILPHVPASGCVLFKICFEKLSQPPSKHQDNSSIIVNASPMARHSLTLSHASSGWSQLAGGMPPAPPEAFLEHPNKVKATTLWKAEPSKRPAQLNIDLTITQILVYLLISPLTFSIGSKKRSYSSILTKAALPLPTWVSAQRKHYGSCPSKTWRDRQYFTIPHIIHMDSTGFHWLPLASTGLDWTANHKTGLHWTLPTQNWTRLDWTGLDCQSQNWTLPRQNWTGLD
ncbi:uncharacterized protein LACBIDRAFT_322478 [Laccaria bicolor S238N-H82]|uniref:Predicted protein n=1 Tax=Laccaria bicolor (strain S238N-H82 / ATCC MYA-4686) TaxID=486041 RepID=B0CWF7_LACBS|nr:uncharacterized protein LACBIDRAFT_322478 [Laccaria bicolor S238N-H82]EDR13059.1 predicted protein [Laccaria bicolor S238N-H82]|eukprot:XP_001875557.1 predicted protein [Laccaria bicolor S238N-H82]